MTNMIGRVAEKEELMTLYRSGKPEFVAVYGRRRVGKTFLIKDVFEGKMAFYHTGISPLESRNSNLLQDQLKSFHHSLVKYGLEASIPPTNWLDAFFQLEELLESLDNQQRQVVFIDELPWLDTPRSGFMSAFEHFWNGWGSGRDNLMLVVCGSATSWIEDNLINSHGGLYGRLTYEIKLSPFTLRECEEYFQAAGLQLTRYDVVQAYMSVGGIPYYLGFFRKGLSIGQNIDTLFFAKNAKLNNEFDRLFSSQFSNPETYKKIIHLLASRHSGFTREEIADRTGIPKGGGLSKMLAALEAGDFVAKYVPFGGKKREERYKLVDNFCLFYSKFKEGLDIRDPDFWEKNQNAQSISSWKGVAFEEVCFTHIQQIKNALGVGAVTSRESVWNIQGDDGLSGTQIDMLIDRADRVVNLCEMKFYKSEFTIDKAYDAKLRQRTQLLVENLPRNRAVHLTMITTFGLTYNEYSGHIQKLLTLDDLFEK